MLLAGTEAGLGVGAPAYVRHRPEVMGKVLGIVYRCIAIHLIRNEGFTRSTAQTGAVTLIQHYGSASALKGTSNNS